MKRLLTILSVLSIILTSCYQEPRADAHITPNPAYIGEDIYFNNYSVNTEYVEWDFGDGIMTNTFSPVHAYNYSGTYNVTLKAFGKKGGVDVLTFGLDIVYPEPIASASISPNPAYVSEDVLFNNFSEYAEYVEWDFGDGTISSIFSPVHAYDDPGIYDVTLTVFGSNNQIDVLNFELDVIGSSVKIVVQEWYNEYYVPGASIILYPTYQDWLDQTNMVDEQFTNIYGECIFEGLRFQRYYVDVWEEFHDNYTLAGEEDGIKYIETQILDPMMDNTFIAWVDYYAPDGKKSANRSSRDRNLNIEEGDIKSRPFKSNKISVPKK